MDEADDGTDSDRDEPTELDDRDESRDAPRADASLDAADAADSSDSAGDVDAVGASSEDVEALREEVRGLREDLANFEESVDERTVHRSAIEDDLKHYVRRRLRRGHARGWGPYLVLLYGTAMTIGALYSPVLSSGWAIFAMFVIWLSTLGLYVLMLLVGAGISFLHVPFKAVDAIRERR